MANRPDKFPRWADAGGVATEPTEAKKDVGNTRKEKPPNFILNWLFLKIYQWLLYFDERTGAGLFGDGSDGSFTLDGAATPTWATRSGSVYTLQQDVYLLNLTINSGVQLNSNGFRIYVLGTLTLNSDGVHACIFCNGAAGGTAAAGNAPGAGGAAGGVGGSIGASGAGTSGKGGAGGNNGPGNGAAGLGQTSSSGGGSGGAGTAANGGTVGTGGAAGIAAPGITGSVLNGGIGLKNVPTLGNGLVALPTAAQLAQMSFLQGGAGGGGGGGAGTNNASGAGGGGGGGVVYLLAALIVTTGAGPHLQAKGGDGGPGIAAGLGYVGGGGSGGGGMVYCAYLALVSGTIVSDVTAGAVSGVTGSPGSPGSLGSALVFQVVA